METTLESTALGDNTDFNIQPSLLCNSDDSFSPNITIESESVLNDGSHVTMSQILGDESLMEKIRSQPDLSSLGESFHRRSIDEVNFKKGKGSLQKSVNKKTNQNDSNSPNDSSVSSIDQTIIKDIFNKIVTPKKISKGSLISPLMLNQSSISPRKVRIVGKLHDISESPQKVGVKSFNRNTDHFLNNSKKGINDILGTDNENNSVVITPKTKNKMAQRKVSVQFGFDTSVQSDLEHSSLAGSMNISSLSNAESSKLTTTNKACEISNISLSNCSSLGSVSDSLSCLNEESMDISCDRSKKLFLSRKVSLNFPQESSILDEEKNFSDPCESSFRSSGKSLIPMHQESTASEKSSVILDGITIIDRKFSHNVDNTEHEKDESTVSGDIDTTEHDINGSNSKVNLKNKLSKRRVSIHFALDDSDAEISNSILLRKEKGSVSSKFEKESNDDLKLQDLENKLEKVNTPEHVIEEKTSLDCHSRSSSDNFDIIKNANINQIELLENTPCLLSGSVERRNRSSLLPDTINMVNQLDNNDENRLEDDSESGAKGGNVSSSSDLSQLLCTKDTRNSSVGLNGSSFNSKNTNQEKNCDSVIDMEETLVNEDDKGISQLTYSKNMLPKRKVSIHFGFDRSALSMSEKTISEHLESSTTSENAIKSVKKCEENMLMETMEETLINRLSCDESEELNKILPAKRVSVHFNIDDSETDNNSLHVETKNNVSAQTEIINSDLINENINKNEAKKVSRRSKKSSRSKESVSLNELNTSRTTRSKSLQNMQLSKDKHNHETENTCSANEKKCIPSNEITETVNSSGTHDNSENGTKENVTLRKSSIQATVDERNEKIEPNNIIKPRKSILRKSSMYSPSAGGTNLLGNKLGSSQSPIQKKSSRKSSVHFALNDSGTDNECEKKTQRSSLRRSLRKSGIRKGKKRTTHKRTSTILSLASSSQNSLQSGEPSDSLAKDMDVVVHEMDDVSMKSMEITNLNAKDINSTANLSVKSMEITNVITEEVKNIDNSLSFTYLDSEEMEALKNMSGSSLDISDVKYKVRRKSHNESTSTLGISYLNEEEKNNVKDLSSSRLNVSDVNTSGKAVANDISASTLGISYLNEEEMKNIKVSSTEKLNISDPLTKEINDLKDISTSTLGITYLNDEEMEHIKDLPSSELTVPDVNTLEMEDGIDISGSTLGISYLDEDKIKNKINTSLKKIEVTDFNSTEVEVNEMSSNTLGITYLNEDEMRNIKDLSPGKLKITDTSTTDVEMNDISSSTLGISYVNENEMKNLSTSKLKVDDPYKLELKQVNDMSASASGITYLNEEEMKNLKKLSTSKLDYADPNTSEMEDVNDISASTLGITYLNEDEMNNIKALPTNKLKDADPNTSEMEEVNDTSACTLGITYLNEDEMRNIKDLSTSKLEATNISEIEKVTNISANTLGITYLDEDEMKNMKDLSSSKLKDADLNTSEMKEVNDISASTLGITYLNEDDMKNIKDLSTSKLEATNISEVTNISANTLGITYLDEDEMKNMRDLSTSKLKDADPNTTEVEEANDMTTSTLGITYLNEEEMKNIKDLSRSELEDNISTTEMEGVNEASANLQNSGTNTLYVSDTKDKANMNNTFMTSSGIPSNTHKKYMKDSTDCLIEETNVISNDISNGDNASVISMEVTNVILNEKSINDLSVQSMEITGFNTKEMKSMLEESVSSLEVTNLNSNERQYLKDLSGSSLEITNTQESIEVDDTSVRSSGVIDTKEIGDTCNKSDTSLEIKNRKVSRKVSIPLVFDCSTTEVNGNTLKRRSRKSSIATINNTIGSDSVSVSKENPCSIKAVQKEVYQGMDITLKNEVGNLSPKEINEPRNTSNRTNLSSMSLDMSLSSVKNCDVLNSEGSSISENVKCQINSGNDFDKILVCSDIGSQEKHSLAIDNHGKVNNTLKSKRSKLSSSVRRFSTINESSLERNDGCMMDSEFDFSMQKEADHQNSECLHNVNFVHNDVKTITEANLENKNFALDRTSLSHLEPDKVIPSDEIVDSTLSTNEILVHGTSVNVDKSKTSLDISKKVKVIDPGHDSIQSECDIESDMEQYSIVSNIDGKGKFPARKVSLQLGFDTSVQSELENTPLSSLDSSLDGSLLNFLSSKKWKIDSGTQNSIKPGFDDAAKKKRISIHFGLENSLTDVSNSQNSSANKSDSKPMESAGLSDPVTIYNSIDMSQTEIVHTTSDSESKKHSSGVLQEHVQNSPDSNFCLLPSEQSVKLLHDRAEKELSNKTVMRDVSLSESNANFDTTSDSLKYTTEQAFMKRKVSVHCGLYSTHSSVNDNSSIRISQNSVHSSLSSSKALNSKNIQLDEISFGAIKQASAAPFCSDLKDNDSMASITEHQNSIDSTIIHDNSTLSNVSTIAEQDILKRKVSVHFGPDSSINSTSGGVSSFKTVTEFERKLSEVSSTLEETNLVLQQSMASGSSKETPIKTLQIDSENSPTDKSVLKEENVSDSTVNYDTTSISLNSISSESQVQKRKVSVHLGLDSSICSGVNDLSLIKKTQESVDLSEVSLEKGAGDETPQQSPSSKETSIKSLCTQSENNLINKSVLEGQRKSDCKINVGTSSDSYNCANSELPIQKRKVSVHFGLDSSSHSGTDDPSLLEKVHTSLKDFSEVSLKIDTGGETHQKNLSCGSSKESSIKTLFTKSEYNQINKSVQQDHSVSDSTVNCDTTSISLNSTSSESQVQKRKVSVHFGLDSSIHSAVNDLSLIKKTSVDLSGVSSEIEAGDVTPQQSLPPKETSIKTLRTESENILVNKSVLEDQCKPDCRVNVDTSSDSYICDNSELPIQKRKVSVHFGLDSSIRSGTDDSSLSEKDLSSLKDLSEELKIDTGGETHQKSLSCGSSKETSMKTLFTKSEYNLINKSVQQDYSVSDSTVNFDATSVSCDSTNLELPMKKRKVSVNFGLDNSIHTDANDPLSVGKTQYSIKNLSNKDPHFAFKENLPYSSNKTSIKSLSKSPENNLINKSDLDDQCITNASVNSNSTSVSFNSTNSELPMQVRKVPIHSSRQSGVDNLSLTRKNLSSTSSKAEDTNVILQQCLDSSNETPLIKPICSNSEEILINKSALEDRSVTDSTVNLDASSPRVNSTCSESPIHKRKLSIQFGLDSSKLSIDSDPLSINKTQEAAHDLSAGPLEITAESIKQNASCNENIGMINPRRDDINNHVTERSVSGVTTVTDSDSLLGYKSTNAKIEVQNKMENFNVETSSVPGDNQSVNTSSMASFESSNLPKMPSKDRSSCNCTETIVTNASDSREDCATDSTLAYNTTSLDAQSTTTEFAVQKRKVSVHFGFGVSLDSGNATEGVKESSVVSLDSNNLSDSKFVPNNTDKDNPVNSLCKNAKNKIFKTDFSDQNITDSTINFEATSAVDFDSKINEVSNNIIKRKNVSVNLRLDPSIASDLHSADNSSYQNDSYSLSVTPVEKNYSNIVIKNTVPFKNNLESNKLNSSHTNSEICNNKTIDNTEIKEVPTDIANLNLSKSETSLNSKMSSINISSVNAQDTRKLTDAADISCNKNISIQNSFKDIEAICNNDRYIKGTLENDLSKHKIHLSSRSAEIDSGKDTRCVESDYIHHDKINTPDNEIPNGQVFCNPNNENNHASTGNQSEDHMKCNGSISTSPNSKTRDTCDPDLNDSLGFSKIAKESLTIDQTEIIAKPNVSVDIRFDSTTHFTEKSGVVLSTITDVSSKQKMDTSNIVDTELERDEKSYSYTYKTKNEESKVLMKENDKHLVSVKIGFDTTEKSTADSMKLNFSENTNTDEVSNLKHLSHNQSSPELKKLVKEKLSRRNVSVHVGFDATANLVPTEKNELISSENNPVEGLYINDISSNCNSKGSTEYPTNVKLIESGSKVSVHEKNNMHNHILTADSGFGASKQSDVNEPIKSSSDTKNKKQASKQNKNSLNSSNTKESMCITDSHLHENRNMNEREETLIASNNDGTSPNFRVSNEVEKSLDTHLPDLNKFVENNENSHLSKELPLTSASCAFSNTLTENLDNCSPETIKECVIQDHDGIKDRIEDTKSDSSHEVLAERSTGNQETEIHHGNLNVKEVNATTKEDTNLLPRNPQVFINSGPCELETREEIAASDSLVITNANCDQISLEQSFENEPLNLRAALNDSIPMFAPDRISLDELSVGFSSHNKSHNGSERVFIPQDTSPFSVECVVEIHEKSISDISTFEEKVYQRKTVNKSIMSDVIDIPPNKSTTKKCSRKSSLSQPKNMPQLEASESNEIEKSRPYNLRKSSPPCNLTSRNLSKKNKKSVTFGSVSKKSDSSGESKMLDCKSANERVSTYNQEISIPKNLNKVSRRSNNSEEATQGSDHIFTCPEIPSRRSRSSKSEYSSKRTKSNLEDQSSSGEYTSNSSKRRRSDEKTINELSYDTILDVSEIPKDKTAVQKKLIYHSTPINPVLIKKKSKRSKKKSDTKSVISQELPSHKDQGIQVSKSAFASSVEGTNGKLKSSEFSTSYSYGGKRKGNFSETSDRKKAKPSNGPLQEGFLQKSSVYSSESPSRTLYNDLLENKNVRFIQDVKFRDFSSNSDSTLNQDHQFIRRSNQNFSSKPDFSSTFMSTLTSSDDNRNYPSKKVLFRGHSSYIDRTKSVSDRNIPESDYSPLDHSIKNKQMDKVSTNKNRDFNSSVHSTSDFDANSDYIPVNKSLADVTLSSIGKNTTVFEWPTLKSDFTISNNKSQPAKTENIRKKSFKNNKKSSNDDYDYDSDIRFAIDGKPYSFSKYKFPCRWVSKDLFNFLYKKLENSYGFEAHSMTERLISHFCSTVSAVDALSTSHEVELSTLIFRNLLVRYNICLTMIEYCTMIMNFTPFDFQRKVLPMHGYFGSFPIKKTIKFSDPILSPDEILEITL